MPIVIPNGLPAYKILSAENVAVLTQARALSQDIRPLEIVILNLMPFKEEVETQLLRLLSNTPLQINVTFLTTDSYQGTHTPLTHLKSFYKTFKEIKSNKYDGLIITGAPLEQKDFKEVKYWDELTEIFDYANKHITSTIYICWAAFAGLYYHYGISKEVLKSKRFGVYQHHSQQPFDDLLRGLDQTYPIPHSCYAKIDTQAIEQHYQLEVLTSSDVLGPVIIKSKDQRHIFITGHLEYHQNTLHQEYLRDLEKGVEITKPCNYYDTTGQPLLNWRSSATLIFSNWLNYYVYQITPYDLKKEEHQ